MGQSAQLALDRETIMEDQIVPFTVKELLIKIDSKIDTLKSTVDSKVDVARFSEVEKRLVTIEQNGSQHSQGLQKQIKEIEFAIKEKVNEINETVQELKEHQITEEALVKYQESSRVQNTRFRFMAWGLVISIFSSFIATAGMILKVIFK